MTSAAAPAFLARYWGKADPTMAARGRDHHTVVGHSLDVAACAFILVESNHVLRQQFAQSAGLAVESIAITLAAVCALHDIGKLDTRFQRKAPVIADVIRPESAGVVCGPYDHGAEGFRQTERDESELAAVTEHLGDAAVCLLRAVCGHHGSLPRTAEASPTYASLDRKLRREDQRAQRALTDSLIPFFKAIGAQLPWPAVASGAVVQRLAGLCAIADWVGSDVEHFGYEPLPTDLGAYWERACQRATIACQRAGLVRATSPASGFSSLFPGYTPRDVQKITEGLELVEPSLVIVEAEMGKGKTEAALSLAAHFLDRRLADGLTVALPTMATSNAMFRRVEELAVRLYPTGDVHLALAHGRARREASFQRLIQRSLRATDADAAEASVVCARWLLNRKRILLAQVGVGTIDQSLQAALTVRHQFVRMFGLARNVVIIDEVHAYDAYMEALLEHLLAWLGALRVPVILLSATLPSDRRAALARAWRGASDQDEDDGDDLQTATARPYPLVSVTTANGTSLHHGAEAAGSKRIVLERAIRSSDDTTTEREVAARLVRAAAGGARVVWIRNTVREAQRAFAAVSRHADAQPATLFHARFRGADRSRIEHGVLRDFGKDAPAGGRILVATQVVEQSLDLDFDELHTDLAPVDLVLQRCGRLHRHRRCRPKGCEVPRLVVHSPSDDDAGALRFGPSRYVYDEGTLWLANRALRCRETLELPNDIRQLVEETYHPASRAALIPQGGAKLEQAEAKRSQEVIARGVRARQCCIPATDADADGGAGLDDDEDAVQAFTRDGTSATVLPFWWDGTDGRSLDADAGAPAWLLDEASADAWKLAGELLDQTLSLPARGEVDASPTAGGEAWRAWQTRFRRFADSAGMGNRIVPLPLARERDLHRGWLHMGGRRRRVLYSATLGLLMPSEKDEKEQR